MTVERIDQLYKSLYKYIDELKELGLSDRPVSEELFKLYARDANELGDLLIQEGKKAGQIDDKAGQEMKDRLMKTLEIFKVQWK